MNNFNLHLKYDMRYHIPGKQNKETALTWNLKLTCATPSQDLRILFYLGYNPLLQLVRRVTSEPKLFGEAYWFWWCVHWEQFWPERRCKSKSSGLWSGNSHFHTKSHCPKPLELFCCSSNAEQKQIVKPQKLAQSGIIIFGAALSITSDIAGFLNW